MQINPSYPYSKTLPFDIPRAAWCLDLYYPKDDERAVRPIQIIGFTVGQSKQFGGKALTIVEGGVGWDITEALTDEKHVIAFFDTKAEALENYDNKVEESKNPDLAEDLDFLDEFADIVFPEFRVNTGSGEE